MNPGGTGTATLNVTDAGGFTGNVTLAVSSALPTGVTAAFSPNPTTGSSVLTLTASSSAPAANQVVTITGTSGTLTASANVTVGVHAPSFRLAASPVTVGINQGASGTSTITVVPLYGFSSAVNLTVTGLPTGVTASFSPASTTSASTLTLTASSSATPGTSNLTVTGTSGTLTATTNVALSIHGPSFTLSSSSTVSLGQGSTAAAYVYVFDQYGFTGSVNLAVSGLPNGVTATFSSNPTTVTSTLTFSAGSSAAVGQSLVTITGTSGALSATTTLSLSVFAPTFTLYSSGSLSIGQGTSASTYVDVSPLYGFTGSVTLSIAGLPSGVTALFTPNPTTSNSTVSFVAGSSAKVGQYALTITGVSGSQTATAALTLSVYAPTFTVSSYGGVNIGQGTSGTSYIYVTPEYGFTGSVSLAASGLPSGVTASFSPNPTTGTSTLTLQASSTAALGQYTVTLTGTSGTQTASTTLTVGVYVPTFTLSNYGGITVGQGSSSSGYVYVTPAYGFTGSVTMSVAGLPSGVTASFSPNPTTGTSTLLINAGGTAAVGQYTLTVTGTSGTQTATTTVTLGVYKPTFTLSSGGLVSIGQGASATSYVYVYPQYGFTGSVAMSVSGLPSGVTASFSPNPTTSSSLLTLTASSSAPLGQYTLTITGTSGSTSATATLTLAVYVPTFTMSGPYSISAGQGSSSTGYVYVSPEFGFTGSVNLAVSGLPNGVTASFSPNPTTYSSTLTLAVGASVPVGTSTVTLTGTSGSQTVTTTFQLSIYAPGFSLSSSLYTLSLNEGASGSGYVYVSDQYGFAGNVTLSATGLPSGVTASFTPNPTAGTSMLAITASSSATPGQAVVTLTGTSGVLTASTSFTLTVNAPSFTLNAAPAEVFLFPGGSEKSTVTPVTQFGFSGSVSYAVSGLPSGVTATFSPNPTSGSSTLLLTAASTAAATSGTATITGTSGSITATAPLALTVRTAPIASATALSLTSGGGAVSTVAAGAVITATATVIAGSTPLTKGQVNFCDAAASACDTVHLLGSAQLTSAGSAIFQFIPGPGSHSYKAVFAGTNANAASTSAVSNLAVTAAKPSATAIAQSGSAGNYTLTATVTGQGPVAPSGNVSFLDTSDGNFPLGSATLGKATAALTLSVAQSPYVGMEPESIATGDFNGDGIPDLAVANYDANTITILLGKGDGTFTAAASLTTGNEPYSVVAGDFNHDGHLDLAVTLTSSNSVSVFLGKGDGAFTAASSAAQTGTGPTNMVAGDYNGDGLLDLAVVNGSSGTLTILLGNGDGSFTPANLSPQLGSSPQAIAPGDFNGDGIQDLAVANFYSNTVTILLGAGDGTFATVGTIATGSYPSSLATADLNADGKVDLVVANEYSSTLSILLGNGDGTFTAAAAPSVGSYPIAVAVADLNGDGKADLVTTNYYAGSVSVLLGNGDGTFAVGPIAATGTYPLALAIGDWNGDGVKDIVSMNTGTDTLTILTSQLAQKATATAAGVSPVGQGQHAVAAGYPGTSVYAGSTSGTTLLTAESGAPEVTLSVPSGNLTTAQTLAVTIVVSGGSANAVPTGTVQLTSGSYLSAKISLSGGTASILIPAGSLAAGTDTLSVGYVPDAASSSVYTSATGSGSVTVTKATPSVTVTPSPTSITSTQPVTLTVAVSAGTAAPTATGSVTLFSGSYTSAATTLSGGSAAIAIAAGTLPSGTDALAATFTPDAASAAIYTSATGSGSVAVGLATPVITWATPLSIVYGTALSSAQLNASSPVAGSFSYVPAAGTVLAAGPQTLSVTFTPTDTTSYQTVTGSVALNVNKAALSLTAASASRAYGLANPAFTGAVTGAVNGDTFTESFSTGAVVTSPSGTYPIVPAVTGANSANYTITPSNGTLTIVPAGVTANLVLSNANLTFTSTVASVTSGVPTGSVNFYAGQTMLGTGTLVNGVASYTVASFPSGDVNLSAQYSGDVNFVQSTSAAYPVLTVSAGSSTLTVSQAGTASDVLSLGVAPGYTGRVQFSCSGLPQYASCSFAPPSVGFTGSSNAGTSTLTIHTGGVATLSVPASPFENSRASTWAAALGLPSLLALVLAGRRRKFRLDLGTMALLLMLCAPQARWLAAPVAARRTPRRHHR